MILFLKILLNEKYLMTINFIVVFYMYNNFFSGYMLANSEFYSFFIDVIFISLFSYIGTIVVLFLLICLIYIIYIDSNNLNSLTIFNKLEAVAIVLESIDGFENMDELQVKFDQILLNEFT